MIRDAFFLLASEHASFIKVLDVLGPLTERLGREARQLRHQVAGFLLLRAPLCSNRTAACSKVWTIASLASVNTLWPHSVVDSTSKAVIGQHMELTGHVTRIDGDKVTISLRPLVTVDAEPVRLVES